MWAAKAELGDIQSMSLSTSKQSGGSTRESVVGPKMRVIKHNEIRQVGAIKQGPTRTRDYALRRSGSARLISFPLSRMATQRP